MSSRGVFNSNCYAYFLNIVYFKTARSYHIFTPAFICFRKSLYLCILFLLLQPKGAQNELVPLGALLTKGVVCDNLPQPLGPWRSLNSKWRPLLKREVTHLVINSICCYVESRLMKDNSHFDELPLPYFSYVRLNICETLKCA